MKNMFQNLAVASVGLVALAAIAPAPAQALTFNFSVIADGGSLDGQTFTGFFSFDDSTFTGIGLEIFDVTDIEFSFADSIFTAADASSDPFVTLADGEVSALTYIVGNPAVDPVSFAFEEDFFLGGQLFTYDLGGVDAGFGDVAFGEPIPEPLTVVGSVIFGGFGALGLKARAKKRKTAA